MKISLDKVDDELSEIALMLILDVKTRLSSTHQMLSMYCSFIGLLII